MEEKRNFVGNLLVTVGLFLSLVEKANGTCSVQAFAGVQKPFLGDGAYSGDGGKATSAKFSYPRGFWIDNAGDALIADYDNKRVRKVDMSSEIVSTFAGSGNAGRDGDGLPATAAGVQMFPYSICGDSVGNVYIGDNGNPGLRKVAANGIHTFFAGHWNTGFSGDGGPATSAEMQGANGCAVVGGDVYFVDGKGFGTTNNRIRKVSGGLMSSYAGSGAASPIGFEGTLTSTVLNDPYSMFINTNGDMFVAEWQGRVIKLGMGSGLVSTVAGFVGTDSNVHSGNGGPATSAGFDGQAMVITMDKYGNLIISVMDGTSSIRVVRDSDKIISQIGPTAYPAPWYPASGDGGPATSAIFAYASGLFADDNDIYFVDHQNCYVRKLTCDFTIIDPPTPKPTMAPSAEPSLSPTAIPTVIPSTSPSAVPSVTPSAAPTFTPSGAPSAEPSIVPTASPSVMPTAAPSALPSVNPSAAPSVTPSEAPSATPSATPSAEPSVVPSATPSAAPSATPSAEPSVVPSAAPSVAPSATPSAEPSVVPSATPSVAPSVTPSAEPSVVPSATPSVAPSVSPSAEPSVVPSATPSAVPSAAPSAEPSVVPSATPSVVPSVVPSASPSVAPSALPTESQTEAPSAVPTLTPTVTPSVTPSVEPTVMPSEVPSASPSVEPSVTPSEVPSVEPSQVPSMTPSASPSVKPSRTPSLKPTVRPSKIPTAKPSLKPTPEPTVEFNGVEVGANVTLNGVHIEQGAGGRRRLERAGSMLLMEESDNAMIAAVAAALELAERFVSIESEKVMSEEDGVSTVRVQFKILAPAQNFASYEECFAFFELRLGDGDEIRDQIVTAAENIGAHELYQITSVNTTVVNAGAINTVPSDKDGDDLATGYFAGVVIGVIVAFLVLLALVYLCISGVTMRHSGASQSSPVTHAVDTNSKV